MNEELGIEKAKKPWFKRWWAFALYALIALAVISGLGGNKDTNPPVPSTSRMPSTQTKQPAARDRRSSRPTESTSAPSPPSSTKLAPPTVAPAPVIDSQLDPRVTQDTIKTTIAVPGWTKRVRPPESVTNRIKREKMSEHGYADSPRDYELDHFIPLELGGSSDQSNLWPEPIGEARQKDKLENKAHADVVSGRLTLKQGRQEIRDAYHIY